MRTGSLIAVGRLLLLRRLDAKELGRRSRFGLFAERLFNELAGFDAL